MTVLLPIEFLSLLLRNQTIKKEPWYHECLPDLLFQTQMVSEEPELTYLRFFPSNGPFEDKVFLKYFYSNPLERGGGGEGGEGKGAGCFFSRSLDL